MTESQTTKHLQLLTPVFLSKFGKRTPLEVIHEINFACNLKCSHCGISRVETREMNTQQVKKAIKEFTDAGTRIWTFTGGEPLLRKDIGELAGYSKDRGMLFLHLATNGILFEKKLRELKNVDKLYFSLDGPKEIHEKTRGIGTYDKVIKAIKLAKEENFDVYIQTMISGENTKNNFFGLRFIFDLAKHLEVKTIFHPIYSHAYSKIPCKFLSPEKNIEALKLVKKNENASKNTGRFDTVYDEWIKKFERKKSRLKSLAGFLYCHLLPDGRVSPCFFKNDAHNGLKEGFLNAFEQLNTPHECDCISFFAEKDFQYSMSFMVKYVMKSLIYGV